jgi:hypothetical protein
MSWPRWVLLATVLAVAAAVALWPSVWRSAWRSGQPDPAVTVRLPSPEAPDIEQLRARAVLTPCPQPRPGDTSEPAAAVQVRAAVERYLGRRAAG